MLVHHFFKATTWNFNTYAIVGGTTDSRMICVSGIDSVEEKEEIIKDLEMPKIVKICTIAAILARDNEKLEEIEEAWILRDKGFNSV